MHWRLRLLSFYQVLVFRFDGWHCRAAALFIPSLGVIFASWPGFRQRVFTGGWRRCTILNLYALNWHSSKLTSNHPAILIKQITAAWNSRCAWIVSCMQTTVCFAVIVTSCICGGVCGIAQFIIVLYQLVKFADWGWRVSSKQWQFKEINLTLCTGSLHLSETLLEKF